LLLEILRHTPPWVFVLFFVLLALGYSQSKTRRAGRKIVATLPVAMMALSLYGVYSAFGAVAMALGAWLIGVGLALWLGLRLAVPRNVTYSEGTQTFVIPGSWTPLILMMAIFFTKYAVGVILARAIPVSGTAAFIGGISLAYGLFGGLFLSRALVIWRSVGGRYTRA
jgi:uncharacterized protein DUF6622